jgi:hypothetical protein
LMAQAMVPTPSDQIQRLASWVLLRLQHPKTLALNSQIPVFVTQKIDIL